MQDCHNRPDDECDVKTEVRGLGHGEASSNLVLAYQRPFGVSRTVDGCLLLHVACALHVHCQVVALQGRVLVFVFVVCGEGVDARDCQYGLLVPVRLVPFEEYTDPLPSPVRPRSVRPRFQFGGGDR
jgi:hypothetical protein